MLLSACCSDSGPCRAPGTQQPQCWLSTGTPMWLRASATSCLWVLHTPQGCTGHRAQLHLAPTTTPCCESLKTHNTNMIFISHNGLPCMQAFLIGRATHRQAQQVCPAHAKSHPSSTTLLPSTCTSTRGSREAASVRQPVSHTLFSLEGLIRSALSTGGRILDDLKIHMLWRQSQNS